MAETQELPEEVKTFIVQSLACFDTPSMVVKAVKENFGLEITRQRVHGYNPTKAAGSDLGEKNRAIFDKTREDFLKDTAEIGIAIRAVRLRKLDRIAADNANNPMVVMQACEAAAKEMGGAYTNKQKHEHTGPDGKPLPTAAATVTIIQLPDNGRG